MLRAILLVVQVLVSLGIIGLVLLQRGKGAEAGAGFGAGASGTVFGARGARTALSRATAVLAAIFMVNSLALTYMGTHSAAAPQKTILDEASERAPPAGTAPQGSSAPAAPAAGANSAPAQPAPTQPAPAAPAVPATPAPSGQ